MNITLVKQTKHIAVSPINNQAYSEEVGSEKKSFYIVYITKEVALHLTGKLKLF